MFLLESTLAFVGPSTCERILLLSCVTWPTQDVKRAKYSKALARVFSGHLDEDLTCATMTMTSVVVSTPCYWHRNHGIHKSAVAKVQPGHGHCFGRPIMALDVQPRRVWEMGGRVLAG